MVSQAIEDNIPEGCTKIFHLAYWQQFFSSSTTEIFHRAAQSLLIFKGDFISDIQESNADLWYPVWLMITQIFLAFLTPFIIGIAELNDNNDTGSISKNIGLFVGVMVAYNFVFPAIYHLICWCLDMEDMNYMIILDLIAYSQTIMLPIMVIYPIFQMITSASVMKPIAIAVFCFCAAWSQLFIVVNTLKYTRTFQNGSKGQIIGISLAIMILHAGYLAAEGCLIFIVNIK